MNYSLSSKTRNIMTGVSLGVIVIIGVLWWRQFSTLKPKDTVVSQTIVDTVDRGMKPEQAQVFRDRITGLQGEVDELKKSGKRDISKLLWLGNNYYALGELKTSITYFDDILSTNPQDAPALQNKGQSQLERGDISGAESSWRKALSIEPDEPTYFKLTDLIREHYPERQMEIRPILETAIANMGQTEGLLVALGNWYKENNQLDEAISHYEVAVQLSGGSKALKKELDGLYQLRAKQQ